MFKTDISLIGLNYKSLNANFIGHFFLIVSEEGGYIEENKLKWPNLARGRNSTPKQKKRGDK